MESWNLPPAGREQRAEHTLLPTAAEWHRQCGWKAVWMEASPSCSLEAERCTTHLASAG